jgi:hypothetical protein
VALFIEVYHAAVLDLDSDGQSACVGRVRDRGLRGDGRRERVRECDQADDFERAEAENHDDLPGDRDYSGVCARAALKRRARRL